ncbi:hypothetical protein E2C01_078191 [Portunus trituberculatus]|uniref:Uncharacterized protein n=1 Tax=Portunus trituberculatus TaxID=210409 RepID=A0A5B7IN72_PORTR|nr:hypothetical protein [Portunus trituberculatus]
MEEEWLRCGVRPRRGLPSFFLTNIYFFFLFVLGTGWFMGVLWRGVGRDTRGSHLVRPTTKLDQCPPGRANRTHHGSGTLRHFLLKTRVLALGWDMGLGLRKTLVSVYYVLESNTKFSLLTVHGSISRVRRFVVNAMLTRGAATRDAH